jgi:hypothetical protein
MIPLSSSAVPGSRATILPQTIMSKVNVLFFAADPLSVDGSRIRLQLDKEAREVEEEVVAALNRDNVDIKWYWATRLKDVRRGLLEKKPNIVHFSGHGGSQGLVFDGEDGTGPHHVDAAALEEFFSAYSDQIRVVVLNACHSRPQAEAIAQAIGCAIGTPTGISDAAAITFSAAFYSSIAYGQSVYAAFTQACATLRMKGFAKEEDPQLVVRPGLDASTIVLVPKAESAPPGPPIPGPLPPDPPISPPRWGRRTAVATGIALTCGAVYLGFRPDPACAPARAVQRDVINASATAKAQVGLTSRRSVGAKDPMAGPQGLVEARTLHKAGNHAADFALFREAAEAGHPEAMTSLGLAYRDGEGVPAQADSALKWLRAAAGREDLRGMTELGNAYYNRVGVDRDFDHLAKHWYQKAADEGYAEAMRNLGKLYSEGRGVEANSAMALDWYVKAARAGFVDAMVDVGLMYDDGLVVPKNMRLAMCWYNAAADAGSMRGKGAIGIVDEKNLSKADDHD